MVRRLDSLSVCDLSIEHHTLDLGRQLRLLYNGKYVPAGTPDDQCVVDRRIADAGTDYRYNSADGFFTVGPL